MTLSALPVEIWRQIIKDNLDAKDDWLALSTTSSLFLPISQEALFNHVFLRRKYSDKEEDNDDGGCDGSLTLQLFTRSLKERPELAILVRHLRIHCDYYRDDSNSEEEPRILVLDTYTSHPILSNLAWFSMLRHLYLEGFLIDPTLISALKAHPRLASIEFKYCDVSETLLGTDSLQNWSETSISTVSIKWSEGSDMRAWAAVCPAGMRALEFEDSDLVLVNKAFSSFRLLGVTISLTTLTLVSEALPPHFIRFLTGTPQLHRLKLPRIRLDAKTHALRALPHEIIPFLQHFKGPAGLCQKIIHGRPVHSLKLKFQRDTPVDILLVLQLSTAPVTKLRFYAVGRVEDRHYRYLLHAPISIKSFGWNGLMYSYSTYHALYCQALSRLPNLALITLCRSPIPPDNVFRHPKDMVHGFYAACPSLQEIRFKGEGWLKRKHGDWERFIGFP